MWHFVTALVPRMGTLRPPPSFTRCYVNCYVETASRLGLIRSSPVRHARTSGDSEVLACLSSGYTVC